MEMNEEMFQIFYPDEYKESAYHIDFQKKYEEGYRGIIFDIDNTLVPHGAKADKRAKNLIKKLRKIGYGVLFLSNNKEARVAMFNKEIKAPYIYKAGKPNVKNYNKGMEMLGSGKEHTLFVGDQLFTDVWGGKKAGLYTILVRPMDKREEIQIVLKRILEKPILWTYIKKRKKM